MIIATVCGLLIIYRLIYVRVLIGVYADASCFVKTQILNSYFFSLKYGKF